MVFVLEEDVRPEAAEWPETGVRCGSAAFGMDAPVAPQQGKMLRGRSLERWPVKDEGSFGGGVEGQQLVQPAIRCVVGDWERAAASAFSANLESSCAVVPGDWLERVPFRELEIDARELDIDARSRDLDVDARARELAIHASRPLTAARRQIRDKIPVRPATAEPRRSEKPPSNFRKAPLIEKSPYVFSPRLFPESHGMPPRLRAEFTDDVRLVCPACKWDHGHRCSFCLLEKKSPVPRLTLRDLGGRLLAAAPMSAAALLDTLDRYGRATDFARQVHERLSLQPTRDQALCGAHAAENEELERRLERLEGDLEAAHHALEASHAREARLERTVHVMKMAEDDADDKIASLTRLLAKATAFESRMQDRLSMLDEDRLVAKIELTRLRATHARVSAEFNVFQRHNAALSDSLAAVEPCLRQLPRLRRRLAKNQAQLLVLSRKPQCEDAAVQTEEDAVASDAPDKPPLEEQSPAEETIRDDILRDRLPPEWTPRPSAATKTTAATSPKKKRVVLRDLQSVATEVHAILEAKTLADSAGDPAGRSLPLLMRRRLIRRNDDERSFAVAVRAYIDHRRIYAFAVAAGLVCDEVWTPSLADLVVSVFVEFHRDSGTLASWLGASPTVLVERRRLVEIVLATERTRDALRLCDDDDDDDAVLWRLFQSVPSKTPQGEVELDAALCAMLEYEVTRRRSALATMHRAFEPICREETTSFADFVQASATFRRRRRRRRLDLTLREVQTLVWSQVVPDLSYETAAVTPTTLARASQMHDLLP